MIKTIFSKDNFSISLTAEPEQAIAAGAQKLIELAQTKPGTPKHISLLGGSTVFALFKYLQEHGYLETLPWQDLHLWWGDERMVEIASSESNYGELERQYLSKLQIPTENIHPIHGIPGDNYEALEAEVVRYENELRKYLPEDIDGIPQFDLVYLGIGDDTHTASLFPGAYDAHDQNIVYGAIQPLSLQRRITLTLNTLFHAKEVCFLATGASKATALYKIVSDVVRILSLLTIQASLQGKAPASDPVTKYQQVMELFSATEFSPVSAFCVHPNACIFADIAAGQQLDQQKILAEVKAMINYDLTK